MKGIGDLGDVAERVLEGLAIRPREVQHAEADPPGASPHCDTRAMPMARRRCGRAPRRAVACDRLTRPRSRCTTAGCATSQSPEQRLVQAERVDLTDAV